MYRVQAGLYKEAKSIIDVAIQIEEEHGGSRPERMAELTGLYGEMYDEVSICLFVCLFLCGFSSCGGPQVCLFVCLFV